MTEFVEFVCVAPDHTTQALDPDRQHLTFHDDQWAVCSAGALDGHDWRARQGFDFAAFYRTRVVGIDGAGPKLGLVLEKEDSGAEPNLETLNPALGTLVEQSRRRRRPWPGRNGRPCRRRNGTTDGTTLQAACTNGNPPD